MPTKKVNWSPQARLGVRRQQAQLAYALLKESHEARLIAASLIQSAIEWHKVYRDEEAGKTFAMRDTIIYDDNLLSAIENWLTQPDPRVELEPKPKPKPLTRHPKLR